MLTSLAPLPIVFAWSTDYVSYAAGNCKGLYLGVVIAYRRSQGLWAWKHPHENVVGRDIARSKELVKAIDGMS